ncbi:MAG TPA: S46 family peptidase, partial [Vicinamibacterales bacterium]
MSIRLRWIGVVLVGVFCVTLAADEGMWTFNSVPRDTIAKKYGVQLTDQWLANLQKAVVRLETGCTGSFVSPDGLVLTNHHCVSTCLADNSTAQKDLVENGFLASSRSEEVRCQGSEVSILMDMENVTE